MASPESRQMIEALRANNPVAGDSIPEIRESMNTLLGNAPLPEDVTFEPVDAGGVPAEWTTAEGAREDRVLVYYHGGGYTVGSIATHRLLVADLSRAAKLRVLSVDYRLAPEHPHPACIDDALAAYRYVVKSGTDPARVAFAGDSAGGGLTAASLLAVRDAGDPLPAAGVCISPWLDMTATSESWQRLDGVDPMLTREGLEMMASAYLAGADPRTPLASPLFAELGGLPPLLIHVGSIETLLDDSTRFAERAKAAGVEVELEVWDGMFHVWHAFAVAVPEGREAIAKIARFLDARLA